MIHSCGSFKIVWVFNCQTAKYDIMSNATRHNLKGGTKGQDLKNPDFLIFLNFHNFVTNLCAGNFSILLLLILCVFKW